MAKKSGKIANVPQVKKPGELKLAQTIVEQGPRDDQARVDGYGQHVGPLQTQFNLSLDKYADDLYSSYRSLASALGLPSLNLSNLTGLNKINKIIKDLNPDALIKRFEQGVLGGRSLNSILELPEKFRRDALGTLADLTGNTSLAGMNIGQMIRAGKMTYDEAVKLHQMVKNGDWLSLSGITKALESMGQNELVGLVKDITDVQAVGSFLGQLVKTAGQLGNSSLVKELSKLFENNRDRNAAMSSIVYSAAMRSDLQTIDAVIKILGGMETLSKNPNAINLILKSYNLDPFYTPSTAKEYRQRLMAVLNQLDPDWCYDYINGQRITKLEPFSYMSNDAKKVFRYPDSDEPDFFTEILIAGQYKPVDAKQLAMTFYKDITFKNRPLDPRQKM